VTATAPATAADSEGAEGARTQSRLPLRAVLRLWFRAALEGGALADALALAQDQTSALEGASRGAHGPGEPLLTEEELHGDGARGALGALPGPEGARRGRDDRLCVEDVRESALERRWSWSTQPQAWTTASSCARLAFWTASNPNSLSTSNEVALRLKRQVLHSIMGHVFLSAPSRVHTIMSTMPGVLLAPMRPT